MATAALRQNGHFLPLRQAHVVSQYHDSLVLHSTTDKHGKPHPIPGFFSKLARLYHASHTRENVVLDSRTGRQCRARTERADGSKGPGSRAPPGHCPTARRTSGGSKTHAHVRTSSFQSSSVQVLRANSGVGPLHHPNRAIEHLITNEREGHRRQGPWTQSTVTRWFGSLRRPDPLASALWASGEVLSGE